MNDYYTVSEYAAIVGKDVGNIRRMLINGDLNGEKMGRQWIIPKSEPYPDDKRIKSGDYKNWRKKTSLCNSHRSLMRAMNRMCHDIEKVYGEQLIKIVLYGSYARGEQTSESDVDIALFLRKGKTEDMHNKMTDVVVDYELEQGITFSVVPIEQDHYQTWKRILPFYKNIDREGIVLWREH